MDVFGQFTLALELPLLFAAPFWIGMWWRRANAWSAWGTMAFVLAAFFVVPMAAPEIVPGLRTDPRFTKTTPIVERTTTRRATEVDVSRRQARIAVWEDQREAIEALDDPEAREAQLAKLGARPEPIEVGEPYQDVTIRGGQAIFWRGGVAPAEEGAEHEYEIIDRRSEGESTRVVVRRYAGELKGEGTFNADFLLYDMAGLELSEMSKGTLQTLRLPPRLITPFLVLILLSFLTPRNSKAGLDRYYAKMKTPVLADHEADRQALEQAYQHGDRAPDLINNLLVSIGLADPMIQILGVQLLHELWVAAEPAGYATHITSNRLDDDGNPTRPPAKILITPAWLDHQVSNHGTEITARTLGLTSLHGSFQQQLVGIPDAAPGEKLDSALVMYDTGLDITNPDHQPFIPPLSNTVVEIDDCDPHGARPSIPAGVQQLVTFLSPGGQIENFCDGICDSSGPFEIDDGDASVCDPL